MKLHYVFKLLAAIAVFAAPGSLSADLIFDTTSGGLAVNIGAYTGDNDGLNFSGTALNSVEVDDDTEVVNVMTDFPGIASASGAAVIDADDSDDGTDNDAFGVLMFTPAEGFVGFEIFEFNPMGSGDYLLTATDNAGTNFEFELTFGPGENRTRISSISDQYISKITLTPVNGGSINSVRQVRLEGLTIPEPSSFMLAMTALASMSLISLGLLHQRR